MTTLDTRLKSNPRSNPTLSMANVAGEGAAAPAPPKKDGGFGLGQAAGYGTLYNSRFEEPFRTAVRHIVEIDLLPDEMSKTVIAFHLNKLCSSVFVNIEDCYKEALKKNELWTSSSKSYSLTNTFCKNLYCDLPEQAPPPPAPAASRSPSPVRLPRHGVGLGKDRALQMRREELERENRRAQETREQSTSSAAKKAKRNQKWKSV